MICAIRGATTVVDNKKEMIYEAVSEMLDKIIAENNIKKEDIVSIVFTATSDIDQAYPAVAARQMGITEPALMCFQEMKVEDSLQKCIRTMVTVEGNYDRRNLSHIYLSGAANLRPDLKK